MLQPWPPVSPEARVFSRVSRESESEDGLPRCDHRELGEPWAGLVGELKEGPQVIRELCGRHGPACAEHLGGRCASLPGLLERLLRRLPSLGAYCAGRSAELWEEPVLELWQRLSGGHVEGRGFSRLEQQDEEHGPPTARHGLEVPELAYLVVYAVSAAALLAGVLMDLVPSGRWLQRLGGLATLACGVFLAMNADLAVATFRLGVQVKRLKDADRHFGQELADQTVEVVRLRRAQRGLGQIDARFGGSAQMALTEALRLDEASCGELGAVAKQICQLHFDRDPDKLISAGAELDASFQLLGSIFAGIVEDYPPRAAQLREALLARLEFRRDGGIKSQLLAFAVERALTARDVGEIHSAVDGALGGGAPGGEGTGKTVRFSTPRTASGGG